MSKRENLKKFRNVIPPWIIIGSTMILLTIFLLWALDNIHRQKETSTLHLLERGEDLIQSLEAGARINMTGIMGQGAILQLQKLLTETAALTDIKYIMIIDAQGIIIAHNDTGKIGGKYPDFSIIKDTAFSRELQWRHGNQTDADNVFEVYRRFSPRHIYNRSRHGKRMNNIDMGRIDNSLVENSQETEQAIFIGLDTSQIEETRKEESRHILLMGAIFLVAGLAGISSLLLVQAYRTTKSSLKRIKAFSDNVVDNMPIGLVALDQDRTVISFNQECESILNKETSIVIGRPADTVLPPDIMDLIHEMDKSKTGIEKEINYHTPEGKRLTLEISVSMLEGGGDSFMGYLVLLRDITEIRSLEKEIERSRRLASIGGLAAGVAHEIRNPLSSIKGFATYFSERYKDVPEDKKTAEIMIREVERLNRVIGQLLEFARPVNIEKRPMPVGALIQHSIKVIEREADKKDIRIKIDDIPEGLEPVSVDIDRMNQVFINLYLNAIEAMPDGGTLTIAATPEKDYRRLRITITDTGRGIDRNDLAHVFDPYFTTKQSGTGLGLSIVHRIIESHNGEITIESESGKGTTVAISLPYHAAPANR